MMGDYYGINTIFFIANSCQCKPMPKGVTPFSVGLPWALSESPVIRHRSPYMLFAPSHMLIAFNHYILKPVQDFLPTYSGWIWTFGCPVSIIDSNTSKLEAFESIISNSSRICIRVNRNTATVDETVNIFPSVSSSTRHPVCWDLWNPTGLTALTLDTIRFLNKANLDDIYNALPSTCHAI